MFLVSIAAHIPAHHAHRHGHGRGIGYYLQRNK
jgi:hypothetical protein